VWLEADGLVDAVSLEALAEEVTHELDAAVEFAVAAPFPNPDQVATDVFA
jgi:TPP-dependent pyruvate/acetoin dehydrogenase alpha subunit